MSTAPPSSPEGPGGSAWPSSGPSPPPGWHVVTDGRDADDLRRRRRRPDRRHRRAGRCHRSRPTAPRSSRRPGTDRPARQQRRRSRPVAAAGPRRVPPRRLRRPLRRQRDRPARADPGRPAAPRRRRRASSTSPPTRQSRRTRAGVATGRPRPPSTTSDGCSPSSDPTSACCRSTPATCAPGCTRTPSRARTSRTDHRPRQSVPAILALDRGRRPERPLPGADVDRSSVARRDDARRHEPDRRPRPLRAAA